MFKICELIMTLKKKYHWLSLEDPRELTHYVKKCYIYCIPRKMNREICGWKLQIQGLCCHNG